MLDPNKHAWKAWQHGLLEQNRKPIKFLCCVMSGPRGGCSHSFPNLLSRLSEKFQKNTRSDIRIQKIESIESIESVESIESIGNIGSIGSTTIFEVRQFSSLIIYLSTY